jgi:hypothetical protein
MDIRLYLDEHVDPDLARYLRRLRYDVLTAAEAGRAGQRIPDEEQLIFAAGQGRAVLTYDSTDYTALDVGWKAGGREHAGIILCLELPIGILCRRVEAHLKRYSAEEQHNLLLWC